MIPDTTPLGLYLHIPFCRGKCPYCDFYSLRPAEELVSRLFARLQALIKEYGAASGAYSVHTVYFGGGTPLLLGARRLARLLNCIAEAFSCQITECTVECNSGSTSIED